jgi:hypothetical protein
VDHTARYNAAGFLFLRLALFASDKIAIRVQERKDRQRSVFDGAFKAPSIVPDTVMAADESENYRIFRSG